MSEHKENPRTSNISDIFDLSDPIREVYLTVLRMGAVSIDDFMLKAKPETDKEETKIYLDILVRQGHLVKFKEDDQVKYRSSELKRRARVVPTSIWDMLDK